MLWRVMDSQRALQELQATELEILEVISGFCAQHDIRWFLDSGTMLGAARHEGFIPWDDDIDIGMLREDYDRFIDLASTSLPRGYSLHTFANTPGFAGMFAKVYKDGTAFHTAETIEAGCDQGIFVDVFPYDVLSTDEKTRNQQLANAKKWQSISYLFHSGSITVPHKGLLGALERTGCRVAHNLIRRAVKSEDIPRRYARSILRDEVPSPDSEVVTFPWPNVRGLTRRMLTPSDTMAFEGVEFPVPQEWERYLEIMYGDWRTLPKEEDRRTHLPLYINFGNGRVFDARS